jgi:hypothetical protein
MDFRAVANIIQLKAWNSKRFLDKLEMTDEASRFHAQTHADRKYQMASSLSV